LRTSLVRRRLIGALLILAVGQVTRQVQASQRQAERPLSGARIDLEQGWQIQSSAKVEAKGDVVSTDAYRPQGWYQASVPTTVLAALVADKIYPDPYFGMNLASIPGFGASVSESFFDRTTPPDSPFAVSWWYRTQFRLAPSLTGKTVWLNFDSINYRANIWLNGHPVTTSDKALGMYRMFEFDVTTLARPGAVNTLAVEVIPPTPTDLSITFVDWNPMPPDKDMGLVRDVYLRTGGPVAVRNTQVVTNLDASLEAAHLTLATDLRNATDRAVEGTLKAEIGDIVVSRQVRVEPQASVRVEFAPSDYPELNLAHPKLWWPYPLGPQNLYRLNMAFEAGGSVSDRQEVAFGVREVTSEIDAQRHRLFKVNGKPILIRGGGWAQDMMLRFSPEREENEIRYVRDMHLNTIRLEGKMMNDHFFETCDRDGVLVIAGWCCCCYWERWNRWQPQDYVIAGESLRDQTRRLRDHPCILTFLYGSDDAPTPAAEAVYLKVFQEEHWPNPIVASASDDTTVGSGLTGVKMTGPYDYVAPNYWLLDHDHGGAFGFNTETSPGPAIPEMATLTEMLPKEHLWPIDDFWNFHAGGGGYKDVTVFTGALESRYGKAAGLEDYVKKSQLMTYEGERAMFEAFGRNKYAATGVIQWMANNAWPSIIWHLYDYALRPGGGYFGAKKACEPLHIQYSYDDRSVVVVNSYYREFKGYTVTAKVYTPDLTEKFSKTTPVDIAADSSTRIFTIPDLTDLSGLYFVRLTLQDGAGKPVSSNFYWLSTQQDVSDWNASDERYTPTKTFADLTGLEKLPEAQVKMTYRTMNRGTEQIETVTLENPGAHLAFCIHLRLLKGKEGVEVAPVLWEDNYFELMPGEKREITATVQRKQLGQSPPYIKLEGWNLAPTSN
jgi:exo-1,4-beta-D-glucosaminidase